MSEAQAPAPATSPSTPAEAQLPLTPKAPKGGDKTPPAEPAKVEKQKFKFKTKIDDIEEEIELDEDEIKRDYQRWKAADKRFQEAATTRKQAEEFISKLKDKQGLIEVLRNAGHDPRQLAEEFLGNELRVEMMNPEQKRIYELERDLFLQKQMNEKREKETISQRETQLTEKLTGQIQGEVIEALQSADIPQTARSVRRMAEIKKIGWERDEDIDWGTAAKMLEREIAEESQAVFSKMSPERMLKIMGKDIADAIRKHDLANIQNPIRQSRKERGEAQPLPKTPGRTYTTEREFDRHLEAMKAQRK